MAFTRILDLTTLLSPMRKTFCWLIWNNVAQPDDGYTLMPGQTRATSYRYACHSRVPIQIVDQWETWKNDERSKTLLF